MKNLIRAAAVTASAIALVGGAATAAHAVNYDIKVNGGYTPNPASVKFTSVGAIGFDVPLVSMGCTSSNGTGSLKVGASVANPHASISSIGFTGCTGPGGLPMTVTTAAGWNLSITGGGPTVWNGTITNIAAHVVDAVGGTTCAFDVNGSVNGSFDEGTQDLTITSSSLTVSNMTGGCLGLIANGDPATFSGTYDLANPATNAAWPINIT
ncbi:hypothetical protein FE697_010365 [Mumia zhuanghuii]|uniref:Neocarzinostatin family protein n=2 Tax=Mumia TaxID=1546255 RepID=A0ABW1QRW6_9ACTN|nr:MULTISPECIES: hypothetical protein [Mumia]KAA1422591.1 hypothetical protein FE697_010365 [Mumia zhuanghuii]